MKNTKQELTRLSYYCVGGMLVFILTMLGMQMNARADLMGGGWGGVIWSVYAIVQIIAMFVTVAAFIHIVILAMRYIRVGG